MNMLHKYSINLLKNVQVSRRKVQNMMTQTTLQFFFLGNEMIERSHINKGEYI